MKKQHAPYFLSLLLIALMMACHDDSSIDQVPAQGPITAVQFQSSELAVAENNNAYLVKIPLNRKATQAGEIIIGVAATLQKFELSPRHIDNKLRLPVAVDDEAVQFTLTPKDNMIIDGDAIVQFTIVQTSEGLVAGEKRALKFTITDNEIPATANFSIDQGRIIETSTSGTEVIITLSTPAPGNGLLHITTQSDRLTYNKNYITEPAAENGILILPIKEGTSKVSFKIVPTDDALFNGSRELKLTLSTAEGAVSRGANKTHTLTITDDELATKAKGYTIGAGLWTLRREYIYEEETGRLKAVQWEQNTPGTLKGVDEYQYDHAGKLIGMKLNAVDNVVFTWEGNRITKKERFRENVLKEYTIYGYDEAGNIGEVAQYYRQNDGSFPLSFLFVYLYHTNGNVYKQLTYQPVADEEDYRLISTKTYDYYLDTDNPFTMVDILPNIHSQPKLPMSYRLEENGFNILYTFSYEFDDRGRPVNRTARSASGSETVNYYYY